MAGWRGLFYNGSMEQASKRPETSPKDFFLHLLSIVALYASAIGFSTLLFQAVDAWFPDTLAGYGIPSFSASAMRWAIATLVVFFPSYVAASAFLNRQYAREPEKRELRVRKWLIYFTLFVAALIILGDAVALVLNFLQGELTVRFALKVLAIAFVAGSVFGYYFWELKNRPFGVRAKAFVYGVSLVALAAVVAGFFVAGSPYEERLRQFDAQRVNDLSMIQSEVLNYWTRTGTVATSTADLADDLYGSALPTDPETHAAYQYQRTGEYSFSLCATFATTVKNGMIAGTPAAPARTPFNANWDHGVGYTCFDRTIDPKLYPPQNKG